METRASASKKRNTGKRHRSANKLIKDIDLKTLRKAKQYSAESIKVLEGLEAVRKRFSQCMGDVGKEASII